MLISDAKALSKADAGTARRIALFTGAFGARQLPSPALNSFIGLENISSSSERFASKATGRSKSGMPFSPSPPDEAGEMIGEICDAPKTPAAKFDGYVDPAATGWKMLQDVFRAGEAWFRTGDELLEVTRAFHSEVTRLD
jgi:hypothetical protein